MAPLQHCCSVHQCLRHGCPSPKHVHPKDALVRHLYGEIRVANPKIWLLFDHLTKLRSQTFFQVDLLLLQNRFFSLQKAQIGPPEGPLSTLITINSCIQLFICSKSCLIRYSLISRSKLKTWILRKLKTIYSQKIEKTRIKEKNKISKWIGYTGGFG